jgi:hypothetical protein
MTRRDFTNHSVLSADLRCDLSRLFALAPIATASIRKNPLAQQPWANEGNNTDSTAVHREERVLVSASLVL